MKKHYYSFILLTISSTLLSAGIVSCSKEMEQEEISSSDTMVEDSIEIIPIDDALATLNDFLSQSSMTKTSSGNDRVVSSIETHYSSNAVTKAGESIPDAYLVNFDDDAGYAVLGANTNIDPIVAVIEQGNTDWETLLPEPTISESECDSIGTKEEYDPVREYLGPGIEPKKLVSLCVRGALYGELRESEESLEETKAGTSTNILLNTLNFGQNVTYCHDGSNRFVTNGCASTAISIIVAYNNYPKLLVDNEWLNLSNCSYRDGMGYKYHFASTNDDIYLKKSDYFTNWNAIPATLSSSDKIALLTKVDPQVTSHGMPTVSASEESFYRTRLKVTSANFYSLKNAIKGWDGTGTMPSAAIAGLKNLGYTGVDNQKYTYITDKQTATILYMLSLGKPVLMCGWTLSELSDSHYWVVDGINVSTNQTLFHCNWGWNGSNNGWFARHCLRADSPVTATKSSGPVTNNGWNHLIVYSYSMDSTLPQKKFTLFYLKHRATY